MRRLPREARDTLFVLVLIGWIVLPQVPHLPLWCTLLVAVVLLWRGVLAVTGQPLPRRRWLIALLVLVVVATVRTHSGLTGAEAGVTLLAALLALKTLELRARRDALVVFFLGFFTILTGYLQSQSLLMAGVTLLALLGLLTALVNAHRPVGQPSLLESARIALRMALAGAPVMIALFVFFPRFAPLWAIPDDGNRGRSGLSQTMAVGQVAELALDDRVAMRVKFDGVPPPQSALYFRGPVLNHFDGREWTPNAGRSNFPPLLPSPARDLQVAGDPVGYEVTLEPSDRFWLLTLDAVQEAPRLPSQWHARMTRDLQWVASRPVGQLLRYRAVSYTDFEYGRLGWDGQPRRDMGMYLQLPRGYNPRTLALAQELLDDLGADPRALVGAALRRLRTGGYVYTLEPGTSGRDSADEFWFDSRAGFCEHIASAFVVLMRAVGVPARIVTGFQGGELNGVDGYWMVRNSDAHAWAEVWYADRGWTRVDPTGAVMPGRVSQFQRLRRPSGVVSGALRSFNPSLFLRMRATWDAVNNRWNQWVLNYTEEQQFKLLEKLGFEQPDWEDLAKVLATLMVAAALGVAVFARVRRLQRDPWLRLLVRVRRRLRRAGLPVTDQASPREMAALLVGSNLSPRARGELREWLLALEQQRYARESERKAASLATLRRQLRQIGWPGAA